MVSMIVSELYTFILFILFSLSSHVVSNALIRLLDVSTITTLHYERDLQC